MQKLFSHHFIQKTFWNFILILFTASLLAAPAFAATPRPTLVKKATSKPTSKPTRPIEAPAAPQSIKAPPVGSQKDKAKAKKVKPKPGLKKKILSKWLKLGPFWSPQPAFHKEKKGGYPSKNQLSHRHIQKQNPKAGRTVWWFPNQKHSWKAGNSNIAFTQKTPQVAYIATYLSVDRYTQFKLKLQTHQMAQIYLDGKMIGKKTGCTKSKTAPKKSKKAKVLPSKIKKAAPKKQEQAASTKTEAKAPSKQDQILLKLTKLLEQQQRLLQRQAKTLQKHQQMLQKLQKPKKAKKKAGIASVNLHLTPGPHALLIKLVHTKSCLLGGTNKVSLHATKKSDIPRNFKETTSPKQRYSLPFLLLRKKLSRLALSPDGKIVAVMLSQTQKNGTTTYWTELRQTSNGKILQSTQTKGYVRDPHWSADGKHYSFITTHRKKGTLWLVNRSTGKVRRLLSKIQGLQHHIWSPNNKFIIYSAGKTPKPSKVEKAGLKRLRGMEDRWPWYRHRSYLYAVQVQSGAMLRLTAGHWTTSGPSIRADGKELLFVRSQPDHKSRFFSKTDVYSLNLETLKATKRIEGLRWLQKVQYSPSGKKLLLLGGASLFGGLGINKQVPAGKLPNEYDTQAYIYDLEKKESKAISLHFAPHIFTAYWHPLDNKIYFQVLNRTRIHLFQYTPLQDKYSHIKTGVDSISKLSFAQNSTRIVYVGKSLKQPGRLYTLDLHNPQIQMLHAPAKKWFKRVQLGRVKSWNFRNKNGELREGRVYYPPGFDARKQYPVIVYYYGGTYPTVRGFDGRYSFHLWTSHGFLVYVLQPSGAIGYGQKHAALHVNEWGSIVAKEIITGTKHFLKNHSYADPKRVGCIGASYGGFMTMYLISRTNMFAAAISHAGISNLSSYWGGGYWGYLYSAIATAQRFPWSHPEFYTQQSPLYAADDINTPLLLLHGDKDTNVPPFESYQMYTALRVLQKPVELVLIKGSNHWVMNHKKRILWTQTILAWFDKQLKKRPLWWETLHGKAKH